MILNNIINVLLFSFLFFMPDSLLAKNNPNDLIHLQADSIQYNFKNRRIFYQGHVHAVRELTDLYADTMIVYYKKNKIDKIVAQGKPAYYSTRSAPEKDLLKAWADKIVYFPLTAQVELLGNVKVQQRENQFSGPKLFYDMKKQRVISSVNQQSKAQLIIEPFDSLNKHNLVGTKNEQTRR